MTHGVLLRVSVDRVGIRLNQALKWTSWVGVLVGTVAVALMAILVRFEVMARDVLLTPFVGIVLTGQLAVARSGDTTTMLIANVVPLIPSSNTHRSSCN